MRAFSSAIRLSFRLLPNTNGIRIPIRIRWQVLLIVIGLAHGIGTLYDAISSQPCMFAADTAHELVWSHTYSVYLRLLPHPYFREQLWLWPAFIGWNLSTSVGFLFIGWLHLVLPASSPRDDPPFHCALLTLACIIISAWALISLLYFFYIPALMLSLITLGALSELRSLSTQRALTSPPLQPKERMTGSALFTLGALPILFY